MTDAYIQRPVEVQALEVIWENETKIREFMREDFDVHGFQIVYVHNYEDDRWVEAHRNHFARVGIIGRRPGAFEADFSAVEKDWLVQARPGGRIEVLKPQEFRKLYAPVDEFKEKYENAEALLTDGEKAEETEPDQS